MFIKIYKYEKIVVFKIRYMLWRSWLSEILMIFKSFSDFFLNFKGKKGECL